MNSIHEICLIPLDFAKPTPYQQLELARAILKFYDKHFCVWDEEDDDSSGSGDKTSQCSFCGVGEIHCTKDTCDHNTNTDKSSINGSPPSNAQQPPCVEDANSNDNSVNGSQSKDGACCIVQPCHDPDDNAANDDSDGGGDDDNDGNGGGEDDDDSDGGGDDDDDSDGGGDTDDSDGGGDTDTCDSVYTSETETGSSDTMLVFWGPTHAWLKNMSLTYSREYSYHPCLLDLVTRVSCLEVEECKIARLLNLLSTEFPRAQVVWLYESHNLKPSWPLGYGLYHRDASTQHRIVHLDGGIIRVMDTLTGSTITEEQVTAEDIPNRLLEHNLSVFATGHWTLEDDAFHQLCQSCPDLPIVRLRREQEIVYEKVAINYVMQFLKKYRGLHVPDECIAIRCTDTETLLCAIAETM